MNYLFTQGKSPNITSYDLIKSFALIIMIIDHIGIYFYPEQLWWKSVGRIGFPIWFYLIGHASGTSTPFKLWGNALFLILVDFIFKQALLPVNALVTIFFMRQFREQYCSKFLTKNIMGYLVFFIFACIAFLPSYLWFEYGSLAFIFGIYGYAIRQNLAPSYKIVSMLVAIISFSFIQSLEYDFDLGQQIFMIIGTGIVTLLLYHFRPAELMKPTYILGPLLRFMGRYTLEIYVAHITLFVMGAYYIKYGTWIPEMPF